MATTETPLSEEKLKPSIFLICPVRDASDEINKLLEEYVDKMEKKGYRVHYPKYDTDQTDPTGGIRICEDNRRAIENADEIHLWYDPSSKGSQFDLGVAFALGKKIVLANKDVHPLPDECFGFDSNKEIHFFLNASQALEIYKNEGEIQFRFDPNSKHSLFNFGMAFALRKPIRFLNLGEILPTEKKSFNNVIRTLDARKQALKEVI